MKLFSVWLLTCLLASPSSGMAVEPDWNDYGRLLARNVHRGIKHGVSLNLVDYTALKQSGEVDRVAAQLAAFPLEKLSTREERLAFYINAYNVLAMKVVLDHWPVASIKDAGSLISPVWKKPAGQLGGKTVTLDELEHRLLRPMGELRIHFAIVCASISCPDLRAEPYRAAQLDAQLHDQIGQFLANPDKGLKVEEQTVRVSKIFDWFDADFDQAGGVEAFIRSVRKDLPQGLPVKASLPYDWALNGG